MYTSLRHPRGFLIWSVGTQVMQCNPVLAIVVWRFFAERIALLEAVFFGRQHVEYAQRVSSVN